MGFISDRRLPEYIEHGKSSSFNTPGRVEKGGYVNRPYSIITNEITLYLAKM
jgi:hypothetical protein